jgi:hypothetical protein
MARLRQQRHRPVLCLRGKRLLAASRPHALNRLLGGNLRPLANAGGTASGRDGHASRTPKSSMLLRLARGSEPRCVSTRVLTHPGSPSPLALPKPQIPKENPRPTRMPAWTGWRRRLPFEINKAKARKFRRFPVRALAAIRRPQNMKT